jgi:hypothetical protein
MLHDWPLLLVLAVFCGPPVLLLAVMLAAAAALHLIRAVCHLPQRIAKRCPPHRGVLRVPKRADPASRTVWPTLRQRRAAYLSRRQAVDDWCTCGHPQGEHVNGRSRCRAEDDEGDPCGCPTFETEPEQDED